MVECPVPLVLASVSPRRREILLRAGYRFTVADPGDVEEVVAEAESPEALAQAKARAKAEHVARSLALPRPALVVAADTVVALGAEAIGKPLDRADAVRILRRLAGTRQRVLSGLCLWPTPGSLPPVVAADVSTVVMRPMTEQEIAEYVASGEADGKAGAYAIQETGDRFVERVEGSFLNVVGFPLELFEQLLPRALRDWGLGVGDRGLRVRG